MTQTARLMETRPPESPPPPSQPVTPSAAQTITQQQPALASPTSTYLPNGYHLPTSPGITPVTVDRPNLAIRHNISDEELLIRQHESLSAQIQRLHSQQPSLKAFVQTQLEQAFPDVRPLNAETTQHAITKDIATQYPKSLQAFWTTPRPKEREPRTLEAPQNQLLTLHKQQLSVLAALRVSDGTLTPASKQLIDAALQHPTLAERERAFANGARPGVYPITVDDGTERGALLAGAFLITKTDNSWATEPTWPNGRALPLNDANGPVVLYTPGEGFEEFTTPAQARQALADHLEQGGATADRLLQQMPLAMQNRDAPPTGDDLMLSAEPLTGDVLAEGIPWMLKRQQEEIQAKAAQAFTQSGGNPLTEPTALEALEESADWSYLLDGSNALSARDAKLADKLQPQWLKKLSPKQIALFDHLEHAEKQSTRTLASLLEKIPDLASFARDRITAAIQRLSPPGRLDADQLKVTVTTKTRIHLSRPSSNETPFIKTHNVSLTDLALKNPTEFPTAESSHFTETTFTLPLTDSQGKPILDVSGKQVIWTTEQLKTLVNTADVGGEYTKLLQETLATDTESGPASEIRKAWKANLSDSLEKDALLAELNPDVYKAKATLDTTTQRGAQWVAAVLGNPDPADRPQVDGKTITANALIQRGIPVQGVMVIGNQTDDALVLYTPGAPDGMSFREVADQDSLNTLLEKNEWRVYTASRKSPVNKDDVAKAYDALKQQATGQLTNPFKAIDLLVKVLKLTGAGTTLQPIEGNVQDELYKQHAQLLIDKADHQSVSSAEVAAQSTINKVLFGVEVGFALLDLLPVVGKGLSAGARLAKTGLRALRANGKTLPRLIKGPGLGPAVYADGTGAPTRLSSVRTAPLRPASSHTPPPRPLRPSVIDTPAPKRDLSAFSVPDDVIKGVPMKANGTYQVGENCYVRYTDATEVSKVYLIDSSFHARSGRVSILDPNEPATRSTFFRRRENLVRATNGEWRASRLPAGTPIKRPLEPAVSTSGHTPNGQPLTKRPRVPEAFPGEKAQLEPPVKGKTVFYKYVAKDRHATFNADRAFSPSDTNLKGDPLPRGKGRHYFTDLAPGDMPSKQLSETIFGRRKFGNWQDKMTYHYEVNTSGLNLIQSPDNPHIFYLETPFSIPTTYRSGPNADLTQRIISHGRTPLTT
ncbi:hypothetical protein K7402_18900 [Pseudomonas fluorescens group sp.]|uniref:DUF6543 domain-containing protein n=1 Tax=Pseudomonas fluorescens TaxID=294 RepID=A0ACD4XSR0_PSEFL|nr:MULTISPECIES: DUF6543 domain-containing protein [Pseudomonas fluorescens group]MBZ6458458.1 hypothetical protein [Pseudomonas fluorescens group sp.]MBZ6460920.1 hypothetical protein [Pseudomonas fluorescens group sp.]MBZ6469465.1 hypothetical protein [Pseudomonas fluorescens group sp.]WQD72003.1 DUF6543 domain-containing protein [Pseudomonas marginalis]